MQLLGIGLNGHIGFSVIDVGTDELFDRIQLAVHFKAVGGSGRVVRTFEWFANLKEYPSTRRQSVGRT